MRPLILRIWATTVVACVVSAAALTAQPLKVIALQIKVKSLNGSTTGTFPLGQTIPVQLGEQVRIELVGTGIVNGIGRETPIQARFRIAAGGNNLTLARSGPNWCLVTANNAGGNGLGQIGFEVTGDYDLRASNRSGRITLQPSGNAPPPPPSAGPDRGDVANRVTRLLYAALLGSKPTGSQAETDRERIFRTGQRGIADVATALAARADQLGKGRTPGERNYEAGDIERVGELYRVLLGRQQSNATLWQSDQGFQNNVRELHSHGLVPIIQGMVRSDEFINAQRLAGF